MFEKARKLVLKDRDGARKALKAELKAEEATGIEAELDQLAAEAAVAERTVVSDRKRKVAEALRVQEVAATRKKLAVAAAEFDGAAVALGAAFDELEALQSKLTSLDASARVDVNMRKWGYVRALWFLASPLCRRLGLSRTMGSKPNSPLADRFTHKETKDD